MRKNTTKKQQELLNFIETFLHEHGFSPSYREIMRAKKYASVSTVAKHIDNLISLGLLQKIDHSARSLELTKQIDMPFADTHDIKPSSEKWLIDIIQAKFKLLEQKAPTQKEIDDLYVLVGAVHVLGIKNVASIYKTKLKKLASNL